MGIYAYLTEQDLIEMRKVKDEQLQELFNEALSHDKSLMISEQLHWVKKGWFKKHELVARYSIYHECFLKDGTRLHQARQQLSATGSKELIITYLFGIINGALAVKGD